MEDLKLFISGLYTHPNPLGSQWSIDGQSVPKGALAVAENISIDRENLAESRRGYKQYGLPSPLTPYKLFNYSNQMLRHAGDQLQLDNGSGVFSNINVSAVGGSIGSPVADGFIQSLQANKNLFLTTNQGVIKLDSPTGNFVRAGVPRGLDLTASVNVSATPFMANNSQVAYRALWGYVDANQNLILGTPSPRAVVTNLTGNAAAVDLSFSVPYELQANPTAHSFFAQIYRSLPSLDAAVIPDDELQLLIQLPYASGNVATFVDTRPDELLGAALYTNTTQDGINATNDRPPYARDLTQFLDMTFYANTKQPHRAIASLVAIPSANDTITVGGHVYTANTSENIIGHKFQRFSTGDLAADLEATITSLSRVVNRDSTNPDYALTFVFGGTFLVERNDFGNSFSVATSNAAIMLTAASDNEAKLNRLYVAKSGQPEAVPPLSYIPIGREDKAILRILAVRDETFVLKEDGIWRLSGTSPDNLAEEAHDTTYQILGAETADRIENSVVCNSNKGIIAISVSGVQIISLPIDHDLLKLRSNPNFSQLSWGLGYDSDRKYLLGVPTTLVDTEVTQVYVFSLRTNAWTTWKLNWTNAEMSEKDNRIYGIRTSDSQIVQERKDYKITDYADDQFPVTILSSTPTTITLSNVANVSAGMSIMQRQQKGLILSKSGTTLTMDRPETWANGSANVYTPITATVQWVEEHGGDPTQMKIFPEITLLFESAQFRSIDLNIASNFFPVKHQVVLTNRLASRWGRFPWGRIGWGSGMGGRAAIRTFFSRDVSRALWINVQVKLSQAFNAFGLAGAGIKLIPTSTRFK